MSIPAKDKAQELVDAYRIILIQSDTDAGEEILCTSIAIECALIAVDEMIRITSWSGNIDNEIEDGSKEFYMKVKEELEKL